jgi:hypothetical protein
LDPYETRLDYSPIAKLDGAAATAAVAPARARNEADRFERLEKDRPSRHVQFRYHLPLTVEAGDRHGPEVRAFSDGRFLTGHAPQRM